ncbi:monooxygenase [Serratia quinivorans]|uniref:monooxygenase n=1 Tax=Serratia quinivorans TaxID=137545 RepID=UPI00217B5BD9|nr:monooxygenase [Serratia quinivorans]CAI1959173.1 Putative monooxygenase ydhR [Serratia quinivorans]CAI2160692.1 Putative monooxygenase ydhR [Serratia quinivorans]
MTLSILQVDFPYAGPWQHAMTEHFSGLASTISQEPGLHWKLWTENASTCEAGGVYLFGNRNDAIRYGHIHAERLSKAGISGIEMYVFEVNEPLSVINSAPLHTRPFRTGADKEDELYLIQTNFSHQGPWGREMSAAYGPLAHDFSAEAGMLWKIWTENAEEQAAGGIFVFRDEANAGRFLQEHRVRLKRGGFRNASCKLYAINTRLSEISLPPC